MREWFGNGGHHERGNRDGCVPWARAGVGRRVGRRGLVTRHRRAASGRPGGGSGPVGPVAGAGQRGAGGGRRHHRRGAPPGPRRRGLRAGRTRPPGQQCRDPGGVAPPLTRRVSPRRPAGGARSQCRRPAGRDPDRPPAPRLVPAPAPAQHHLGRRRRGLRGLGRLRGRKGGARAPRSRARRRISLRGGVVGRSRRSPHGDASRGVPG